MPKSLSEADFIYRLAHDLAAPIRQVNAFAALLQDTDPTQPGSPAAAYVNLIERQSQLAQMMLTALVELSRLNDTKVNRCEFALTSLLQDVAAAVPGLNLTNQLAKATVVLQDQALLLKLLIFMAQNACTYCDKPRWTVRSKPSRVASHISLLIQDNGPGLTQEQWDRYLHPFSRNSGHADLDGLGMGLTMAQKLGELLEVNLSYVQVASGLCFRLTLPLSNTEA